MICLICARFRTQYSRRRRACASSTLDCTWSRKMEAAIYTAYDSERSHWPMPNERQKRSNVARIVVAPVTHSTRYVCPRSISSSSFLLLRESMGR